MNHRLGPLVRVRAVQPREPYRVWLEFEDGTHKEINLEAYLSGPIFESVRQNLTFFRSVKIVGNTIGWENGADIDPDVLYYDLMPAHLEKHETA